VLDASTYTVREISLAGMLRGSELGTFQSFIVLLSSATGI
jgi:hypothetical protein